MFRAVFATLSFLVILILPGPGHGQSIRISYAGTSGYNGLSDKCFVADVQVRANILRGSRGAGRVR